MTSGGEDGTIPKDYEVSSPDEETSGGENITGGGSLKKGPWTLAEDAVLVDYVNKHGEGNWNAVQKHSGLFRCGKSCRLRWTNHLRPDLKKGAFTEEEERRIIELHAQIGNKWARMATELPGRTDNEIKNYWNTRIKRRQRAGLPIYPPDVCIQPQDENQPSQNAGLFPFDDTLYLDGLLPGDDSDIPFVDFENSQFCSPSLLDIPASSILTHGLGPCHVNSFFSMLPPPPKWHRESEFSIPLTVNDAAFCDPSLSLPQFSNTEVYLRLAKFYGYYPSVGLGSHAVRNGDFSSSEPATPWAAKFELPSLQYSDTQGGCNWDPTTSPISLDSVDTLTNSPLPDPPMLADCLENRNSGLLESVIYEAMNLKNPSASSDAVTMMPVVDEADFPSHDNNPPYETERHAGGDPISPLGHSVASMFSEYNTPIDRAFMESTMPGCKVKKESL